ncbi:MAG: TPM domain-containing protein, partial [Flavobacteriaceae bacterium]|nr:TPM domain-containing protein [Flavobacteriaceae bacterium]
MKYLKASLLSLFLIAGFIVKAQFEIPEKPKLETSVYDYVGLLSAGEKNNLEQKLIRYSDSTSTQIVIAIIESTEGENINYLGAQWGQAWGIGQEDRDNGILVLLARGDKRIAINTGYGTEGRVTDALSKRIIETVIIPQFKRGDYYAGLDQGSDALFAALKGEFEGRPTEGGNGGKSFSWLLPLIIFIIIMIILSKRGRNNGGGPRNRKGMDIWDMIILSNMGRGGYSSGSSGGGFGSGGFGGGGFGG